jgi:hypothetical protein
MRLVTRIQILTVFTRHRLVTPLVLCAAALSGCAAPTNLVQERLAISDALYQYPWQWDSKNSTGFAALFTEDAVMDRWQNGQAVAGARVVGRPAILGYAMAAHQGRLADRQTRHNFTAITFLELSAESAVTENMALITHQTAGSAPFIASSGIYHITWRNTDEGWKIKERILHADRVVMSQ